MTDDRVRLHMEASVVSVSSSLVLFWKFCTEDVYLRPYRITMKRIAQIYLDFFQVFQVYLNVILSIFLRST